MFNKIFATARKEISLPLSNETLYAWETIEYVRHWNVHEYAYSWTNTFVSYQ